MKQKIKNYIRTLIYKNGVLKARYNDGDRDLQKSIAHSSPISKEQREEIMNFWNKYLTKDTRKYFNIKWFDVYNTTNFENHPLKYYVPDSLYYCAIDANLSDPAFASHLDDKNMYDLYFHDVLQPKTIFRKNGNIFLNDRYEIITRDQVLQFCKDNKGVIVKPSRDAMAGVGISYWRSEKSSIEDLGKILDSHSSLVGQDIVKQHTVLKNLNDSCVNTLRLVTLILDNTVYVVSSCIIVGGKNSITNHLHRGGLVCGIKEDGFLKSIAFDGKLSKYTEHPDSKIKFAETQIPNFSECLALVKRLAPRFSNVSKLISWDLTINEEAQPVLIETNLTWGGLCQIANGPVFGDLTERVLDQLFLKS